ncbi:MAG: BRO family protein [Sulfuricellaceae bacterium]
MSNRDTPSHGNQVALFERQAVRRTWHNNEWWFAIVDVVEALTDSVKPAGYIKDLRKRDSSLAQGWGQIASPLRIETSGGVQLVNCANTEGMLRIVQSIPSPKAEPFKRWLAKVGYERIQEIESGKPFGELSENERRLMLRNELSVHNKHLAAAAQQAGVATPIDYAVFQDHGYKGLYGGKGAKDIQQHKGLKKNQKILDHMGSTELAANLFRATQTEEKLKRDQIRGKQAANKTHFEVGSKVRQTIAEIGGTMPESLPTPEKSIKQVERELQRIENKESDQE